MVDQTFEERYAGVGPTASDVPYPHEPEMASSTTDWQPENLALGYVLEGRVSRSLGAVIKRLEALRQAGRLTAPEASGLVDLVVAAVSEAYRLAARRSESTAKDTEPQVQLPRTNEQPVRKGDEVAEPFAHA